MKKRNGFLLSVFLAVLILNTASGLAQQRTWKAPDFDGLDLNAQEHSLGQYSGRPLVLYFWASWCPHCRDQADTMNALYREYSQKGYNFVSFSIDRNTEDLEGFIDAKGIRYPVILLPGGQSHPVAQAYQLDGVPQVYLIDQQGYVRHAEHAAALSEILQYYDQHPDILRDGYQGSRAIQ